jgi:hypothetical protein
VEFASKEANSNVQFLTPLKKCVRNVPLRPAAAAVPCVEGAASSWLLSDAACTNTAELTQMSPTTPRPPQSAGFSSA